MDVTERPLPKEGHIGCIDKKISSEFIILTLRRRGGIFVLLKAVCI